MHAVAVIVALLLNGAIHHEVSPVVPMEVCQAKLPAFAAVVAEHNASADPMKIIAYSAACLPLEKAPQGKSVKGSE